MILDFIRRYKNSKRNYFEEFNNSILLNENYIEIDMVDISEFSEDLLNVIKTTPKILKNFEEEIKNCFSLKNFQILLKSNSCISGVRTLKAKEISRVKGIVTSVSSTIVRPTYIFIVCRNCMNNKVIVSNGVTASKSIVISEENETPTYVLDSHGNPKKSLGSKIDIFQNPNNSYTTMPFIPRVCDNGCMDTYSVVPEKSKCEDIQYIKLQESFDDIPVGEIPKTISCIVSGVIVNRLKPGDKKVFSGYSDLVNNKHLFNILYIEQENTGLEFDMGRLNRQRFDGFGLRDEYERNIHKGMFFEDLVEIDPILYDEFKKIQNDPKLFYRSIAPTILGMECVKEALALMMFSGTQRIMGDGIRLRNTINIMLMGDPGIAKSQLLKFVAKVSGGIYVSGKGSSSAGLTASINFKNGFYLEGGALVMADSTICCIDEFDKMDPNDRVSIHEAMEQQTISIAKAGITTVLNTRTSVLAASNMSEFSSAILSRFDCIFLIRDKITEFDRNLAEFVIRTNIEGKKANVGTEEEILDIELMRKYVQYARSITPVLSQSARSLFRDFYINIRQDRSINNELITVRQLESLVRLSASYAKIRLSREITEEDAKNAIRIFQESTIKSILNIDFGGYRETILRMLPINKPVGYGEVLLQTGIDSFVFKKCIEDLVDKGSVRNLGSSILRIK